jgi:hypothetical protein
MALGSALFYVCHLLQTYLQELGLGVSWGGGGGVGVGQAARHYILPHFNVSLCAAVC